MEWYHGWWGRRRISQKQVNEMINNMKKSSIVCEKSKKYHKKEETEAEAILKKLETTN